MCAGSGGELGLVLAQEEGWVSRWKGLPCPAGGEAGSAPGGLWGSEACAQAFSSGEKDLPPRRVCEC